VRAGEGPRGGLIDVNVQDDNVVEPTETVVVTLAGELLRLWGVHHIGAISRTRADRLGPLVSSGPFGIVRNPLYLGNIAIWIGFALTARLVWLAPVILILLGLEYHAIVRWEEQLLESRMAEAYREYASRDTVLADGDEVALIPPVSGGAFRLSAEPLDPNAAVAEVSVPEAGAVATFIGTTRMRSRGRTVQYLDYEAYAEMAEKARTATGAAEVLAITAGKREAMAGAVAARAREVALATLCGKTAVEVAVVDRAGGFLARVGG